MRLRPAYLSLIVLLPLAAARLAGGQGGLGGVLGGRLRPAGGRGAQADARRLARGVLINAVMGTIVAWILVRDELPRPGRRQRDHRPAVRAADDRRGPDAARSVRAERARSDQHRVLARRASLLALLFVTLPFVVRTVQPVLLELDREMEEAAASLGAGPLQTFRHVVFPNLLPAILSGRRARLRPRARRVRLGRADLGQPPVQDRGRLGLHLRADRERRPVGRRRRLGVMLVISFVVLLAIGGLRRWTTRHDRA